MKINEVEKIVGITKKNIRFYEDQGLIKPMRNSNNSYREYTDEDINRLFKIKLFRKLQIPIEEIRNLFEGKLSLNACLDRHEILLNHEVHALEVTKEICLSLKENENNVYQLDASTYLNQLDELEKGGNRFMDFQKTDVTRKKRSALISGIVIGLFCILFIFVVLGINTIDPAPTPILILVILVPLLAIIGLVLAVRERFKEIDGGEENEAAKY